MTGNEHDHPVAEPGQPDSPADSTHEGVSAPGKKGHGWLESVVVALVLALGIRHFLVQAYKIPSGSMIPTLLVGDQLIASKISHGIRLPFADEKLAKFGHPDRGEIVVFRFPNDPGKDFIKRTIAIPGDRIRIEDGQIYVNDQQVKRQKIGRQQYKRTSCTDAEADVFEETLDGRTYQVQYARGAYHSFWEFEEITLGPDEIFVMGDNRDHSNDSRFWGPVDLDLLQGKPLFIHFSWDHCDSGLRWSRFGTGLGG